MGRKSSSGRLSKKKKRLAHETQFKRKRNKSKSTFNLKNTTKAITTPLKPSKFSNALQASIFKLKGSHFRLLSEKLYSKTSKEALSMFIDDPSSFQSYHSGFAEQVSIWPSNPLDVIIEKIKSWGPLDKIADFGCGEARLAAEVENEVHSFDLVALNDRVTACDVSNVPLDKSSMNVVVCCLSLMGTNFVDYIVEANRILVDGGMLLIAEVASRFEHLCRFCQLMTGYGFSCVSKDQTTSSHFVLLTFRKISSPKKKRAKLVLRPCLYKKR